MLLSYLALSRQFCLYQEALNIIKGCITSKNTKGFYLQMILFFREMFYCIAWTTVFVEMVDPPQMNILAAAGARGTLYLVHPDGGVAFLEHRITRSQKVTVSSLVFHPKHCNILFCKLRHLAIFLSLHNLKHGTAKCAHLTYHTMKVHGG